ncbi:hypothetical protein VPHD249_0182 [Vibrio phage D249]|nr:hypothetical protein SIPHO036v1_30008 [Vibrio phage 70E38.1]QZI88073.1 hypothetical protein SIPHO041v1_p0162 [Vibrio phage 234P1]QZI88247.1 hypothetical protein SIPHO035v1_p0156 [Vibrio phage 234P7B]QZI88287.1 hypothetical protein SIPHO082v1_p0010 [Vibrio phage 294E48.1]QZI88613.1 hypothetical protein SIPHO037v1_p0172 [Vibrio phage 70E35.2]QZI88798.1 hypothetical protein SIPHO039v1_p0169 [Vibrio phage 70E35.5a]QZI88981.1 hypothetical protein SIPHO040v1_p0168 [Vibrio phage 70E35.6]QZI89040
MIKRIANLLGYKMIHMYELKPLFLSKEQLIKIELELHSLLLDMEGVGSPYGAKWSHEWMCCTSQAANIKAIVKRYPILRELNRSWLATHPYANAEKVVFPIQAVLAAEEYKGQHREVIRTAELRKELFDHWCKQLIGEYIREDSKILN